MDAASSSIAVFGARDTVSRQRLCFGVAWRQRKLVVCPANKISGARGDRAHHVSGTGRSGHLFGRVEGDRARLLQCLLHSPAQLVLLDPELDESDLQLWAALCEEAGKDAYVRLRSMPGLPERSQPLSWIIKSCLDRLAALILLALLSPVFLAVALLVSVTTAGPVFFRQWRVGKRGRLFKVLKFRSMYAGSEALHHQMMLNQLGLHKLEKDVRVTPVGFWLRRYSLDELPQLINVLRGEMSLVGPRPWALYDAVRIAPRQRHRLNALPGMTGAWQVESRSNVVDLADVTDTDLNYLGQWSLLTDFGYLLRTIPRVLSGFGAY